MSFPYPLFRCEAAQNRGHDRNGLLFSCSDFSMGPDFNVTGLQGDLPDMELLL